MNISIALCTYNGARFLREQLASIAAQSRLPDELVVCDDGSTDETLSLVERISRQSSFPVRVVRNPANLGVAANFQQAIGLCQSELTALADQDDVWLPDKLARAEQALLASKHPAQSLYCSRLQYVDANLAPVGYSSLPAHIDFSNALVENSATGCSIVFGSDIKRRFLEADASRMLMHDWWLYLVATAFGEVVYDPVASILYRQHSHNVAGWEPRPTKLWHRYQSLRVRLRAGSEGMDSLNQASRFIDSYSDLSTDKRDLVRDLLRLRQASFLERIPETIRLKVKRNNAFENFGLRVMLLMGWH